MPRRVTTAEALPFEDTRFDSTLAVLTIHHWHDLERGPDESARAARRSFTILTFVRTGPSNEGVERLRRDLHSGAWDRAHGRLRARESVDLGYRLVTARLS